MEVAKIILQIVIALGSIALCVFVLLQPSKDGMSGALTGTSNEEQPFKNVMKSRPEMRYAFLTKVLAAAIGVLCLVCVFLDKF